MLRSDLRDYSDAYIVVKGKITVRITVISCTSKINGILIENAEDLDIVMPMYNLLEYSKSYSKISGCLWNY